MRGRIRPGAVVGQDHGFGELREDMAGKLFDVHPFTKTTAKLTAWGYGETGFYGNGALYVRKEDLIIVEEQRDPYENKEEVKVKEAPDELAEEVYRAYAYFKGRQLGVGDKREVATTFEADRMFQAWLAVKMESLKDRPMPAPFRRGLPPFPYNPVPFPE